MLQLLFLCGHLSFCDPHSELLNQKKQPSDTDTLDFFTSYLPPLRMFWFGFFFFSSRKKRNFWTNKQTSKQAEKQNPIQKLQLGSKCFILKSTHRSPFSQIPISLGHSTLPFCFLHPLERGVTIWLHWLLTLPSLKAKNIPQNFTHAAKAPSIKTFFSFTS